MRPILLLASCLALSSLPAAAASPPPPAAAACAALRARIGAVPPGDHELLRALAARPDCGFTAAEVYRAAWGDRPLPPPEPRQEHRHEQSGDDDD